MEKQRWEESEKRREEEWRSEKRKSHKKEDAGARKGRKVAKRSHLAKWEMKNCTPLWREAHLEVKMYKTPHVWTTFGSWDVGKVNAGVARSTFRSQTWKRLRGVRMSFCVAGARDSAPCQKWEKREGFVAVSTTTTTTLYYTTLQLQLQLQLQLRLQLQLHYATLHYTNYITLQYTTLHYTPLHYTQLHYTTLHCTYNYNYNCTRLHYTTLH